MKDEQFRELLESIRQMKEIMDGIRKPSRTFKYNISKNNRISKTTPKSGKYWCFGCDRFMVGKGQKCQVCGKRDKSKRQKI